MFEPVPPFLFLPLLRFATLRVRYVAEERVAFPPEPVSVWRGQLGRFLHNVSPPASSGDGRSLYNLFFETPRAVASLPEDLEAGVLGRLGLSGSHVPHPFVLRGRPGCGAAAQSELEPGATYVLEVVLIGSALGHLPPLCAAIDVLGTWGLGRRVRQPSGALRRGRLRLHHATLEVGPLRLDLYDGMGWRLPSGSADQLYDWATAMPALTPRSFSAPPAPNKLRLRFETPLWLTEAGQSIGPQQFTLRPLARAILRRTLALATCYDGFHPRSDVLDDGYACFDALAAETAYENALRWVDRSRYSARQHRRVPLRGLAGAATLTATGEVLGRWQALSRIAEAVHVGRGTAFGYGRVRPELLASETSASPSSPGASR